MVRRFKHHYTVGEARELLPRIRNWLGELRYLRTELARRDDALTALLARHQDLGGGRVDAWVRDFCRFRELIAEFSSREIRIKDLDRGLVDFPALRGNREIFLCWEDGEDEIEFWHDLDSGYAGRQSI
jgi:hypothetical protein